jgi:hypothetical protein
MRLLFKGAQRERATRKFVHISNRESTRRKRERLQEELRFQTGLQKYRAVIPFV